jgi:hypothetical protein
LIAYGGKVTSRTLIVGIHQEHVFALVRSQNCHIGSQSSFTNPTLNSAKYEDHNDISMISFGYP